jgi:hypothetical protein
MVGSRIDPARSATELRLFSSNLEAIRRRDPVRGRRDRIASQLRRHRVALNARIHSPYRTYVLMGDGETAEGSV